MRRIVFLFLLLGVIVNYTVAQKTDANIFGDVRSNGEHLPFVNIYLKGTNKGTATDLSGHYMLIDLPVGKHVLVANSVGYKSVEKEVEIIAGKTLEINFELEEHIMAIDGVVVTGTKTFKRKTESPVIVNVLEGAMLEKVQANTLSEALVFQPGLRLETDCQTCNYTQLRMNGLGGGYSQILINSRPVFSPLTGLYGLEQIPSNMIERIEVVRGGASALYGAGAIGGTVNVITKTPDRSYFTVNSNNSIINGSSAESYINANAGTVTDRRNAGLSIFASKRNRESYDHNDDGYSEISQLKNNSFGFNAFVLPAQNHKIEFSLSSLYEYRYGGNKEEFPAYLADQSEERVHNVLMGGVDYSVNFNNNISSFAAFFGGQRTDRDHYTGIIPDQTSEPDAYLEHLSNPPYGVTLNTTYTGGVQLNHMLSSFITGKNNITVGFEYNRDEVNDEIDAYDYIIDQQTDNFGSYLQSDWALNRKLTLLTGVRFDQHNFVDNLIVSPRISALYKNNYWQFRAGWSTGFRPPQAFDSDLHIAFAGGGIQLVKLSDDLKEERSQSLSASINYDHPTEHFIYGVTAEGFYTQLKDAFVLEEGQDNAGNSILEKKNGDGSVVQGATVEFRANYNRLLQLETGFTFQSSKFDNEVFWSDNLLGERKYLRTPEVYGYYTFTYSSRTGFDAALSGVHTGSMLVPHYGVPNDAGTPDVDELKKTDAFFEHNIKLSYDFNWIETGLSMQVFGGVQNVFNAYQDDFDSGKNRDSGYIYGPSRPRTVFFGVKIGSL